MSTSVSSNTGVQSNAAAANFLSSLNSDLASGGALSDLFSQLLSATQDMEATVSANANASAAAEQNAAASSDASDTASSSGDNGLGAIMSSLQNFTSKWQDWANRQNSSNSSQQSGTSNASAQTTTGSNTTTSSTTTGTSTTASSAASSSGASSDTSSTSDASESDSTDTTTAPSYAAMLAQLQSILHMIQKQIQAAKGDSATGSTTDQTGTDQIQNLLAAGGSLADLLALGQMLEKKLAANASGSTDDDTDDTLMQIDAQLRADLKSLLSGLQQAVQANGATTQTGVTAGASKSTTGALLATQTSTKTARADNDDAATDAEADATADTATETTQSTANTADAGSSTDDADQVVKGALAAADDFLKQLNSLYTSSSSSTNAAKAVASIVAAASTGNDASLDAGQDGSNGSLAANAGANGTAGADSLAAGGDTKSSNPYSFASQLSAVRAQNGGTSGLQSATEQVLLFLNKNAKSGNDQMTLQLHPADLGSINIKLDFATNGTVSGTVVAHNPDTLAMLQKDSRSLERALQDAGLRADPGSLQFSLGDQGGGNSNQTASQQNQSGDITGGTSPRGSAEGTTGADATETDATQSWVITPGRVNIQV